MASRRGAQQVITQNSVAATSISASLPGAATAGDFVGVGVSTTEGTAPLVNGVADNQTGNTYTRDVIGSGVNVGNAKTAIYRCAKIKASGTFTVTYTAAGSAQFALALSEYSGVDTLDKTAAGGSNVATNSETTSTTVDITRQSELGLALLTHDDGTESYATTAPYSTIVENGSHGSDSVTICFSDNIIGAIAVQVCAWTTSGGSTATYDACIATYYLTAASPRFSANILALADEDEGMWSDLKGKAWF